MITRLTELLRRPPLSWWDILDIVIRLDETVTAANQVRAGVFEARLRMQQALQRFTTELESAITHRPHQWFCLRKLWG